MGCLINVVGDKGLFILVLLYLSCNYFFEILKNFYHSFPLQCVVPAFDFLC